MHPVKPPQSDSSYPEREADCQDALDSKIQQLLEESVRAGWTRDELVTALVVIAQRHATVSGDT